MKIIMVDELLNELLDWWTDNGLVPPPIQWQRATEEELLRDVTWKDAADG